MKVIHLVQFAALVRAALRRRLSGQTPFAADYCEHYAMADLGAIVRKHTPLLAPIERLYMDIHQRAELDALPVREQTGVPYASTQHMVDWWGHEQPVMHACGHDLHMACLVGAAELLQSARASWSGTAIVLFQPNEEHTGGAQAMIDDGLFANSGDA
ncbi:hypothetical protein HMPREF1624_08043 [Sporothrix schenckii ATCC 58251]|uniref:Peptidase M20 dimerisation domain-containing protein n=1 Tax=Sporothrix schenckii (strain ATCC 58251 / de Perez 2211183) TaxID=1391915 RepID=U7PJ15_SPOS1|nr:hypothetical protein HMPREF1624_08043 [Sporothrix schenckii ATCC 58251]